ncbi:aspartate carbamoyltransferase catalytic chain [Burkholderia cepacia]|uniref:aspartate carbamoyltransferase catalytic chain n=1 Tax=Burkholderia cepacia TaxID=292 RepID=UPI000666959E|nr:aspartate carbamoyltransferase catalytic chain [Burkholderia cepacia]
MATTKQTFSVPQQELLREAMTQLDMTRDEFASRIRVARRTLDKWLLPDESPDFRGMSDMGRAYVEDIMEWHRKAI